MLFDCNPSSAHSCPRNFSFSPDNWISRLHFFPSFFLTAFNRRTIGERGRSVLVFSWISSRLPRDQLYRECLQGLYSHPPEWPAVTYIRVPCLYMTRTLMLPWLGIPRRGCKDRKTRFCALVISACCRLFHLATLRSLFLSLLSLFALGKLNNGITWSFPPASRFVLLYSMQQLCGFAFEFADTYCAAHALNARLCVV